jgi:N-acyl homoserine lactone hydrolase
MQDRDYELDILVQGYPGKSVCHGGLGWSTVALLRGEGRVALIDVGSFSQREIILSGLAERGLEPEQITDVLLTHAHWDHAVNWVLFPAARVWIGGAELAWALEQPWGRTPVAELYVRELTVLPRLGLLGEGDAPLPGVIAYQVPGHTPGHLLFRLQGRDHDLLFTGDAVKNRAELLSLEADMTYDAQLSRQSIERIWHLWRQRPGTILIPGHDLPMKLEDGGPVYLGGRDAAIRAWFGEGLDQTTLFQLTVPRH